MEPVDFSWTNIEIKTYKKKKNHFDRYLYEQDIDIWPA